MPLILFVEDEVLIRDMVVEALEEAGYSTAVAGDGKTAMALLKEQGDRVRGLVTDINLDTA
jgi:CheY-like chemotaxis protein